jgi:hypothetical protein
MISRVVLENEDDNYSDLRLHNTLQDINSYHEQLDVLHYAFDYIDKHVNHKFATSVDFLRTGPVGYIAATPAICGIIKTRLQELPFTELGESFICLATDRSKIYVNFETV